MRIRSAAAVASLAALLLTGCISITSPSSAPPPPAEVVEEPTSEPASSPPPDEPAEVLEGGDPTSENSGSTTENPVDEGPDAAGWEDVVSTTKSGIASLTVAGCDPSVYSTGSGFLLAPELVVTAAHVVDGAITTSVAVDGQIRDALPLGVDHDADLALLLLDEPVDGHAFTWPQQEVELGSPVAALGYPLSGDFSITDGTLSTYESEGGQEWVRFSAPVNPGNSGGALIDRHGDVVGIVASRLEQSGGRQVDGVSYALSHATARPLIEGWIAHPEPPTAPECAAETEPFESTVDTDVSDPAVALAALTVLAHGEAINNGSYESAYAIFTPQMQEAMGGLEQWSAGLWTSFWRELTLTDSATIQGGVELRMTLRTEQSAEYGPDGATCSDWDLTYVLLWDGDAKQFFIDEVRSMSDPVPCGQ